MPNIEKKIYIHHNMNRQEIRNFLVGNNDYINISDAIVGGDKGLIYYDNKLDRLLVWNGTSWKISQFLDDRDLNQSGDVFVEDIWTQSDIIPTVLTGASASSIVEFKDNVDLVNVPNTYTFISASASYIKDIVPDRYGSFYYPVLKTQTGDVIPNGLNDWRIDIGSDKEGSITFYGGFPEGTYSVEPIDILKLSFWKYTGTKGEFNAVSGRTDIIDIIGNTYSVVDFPYPINSNDIVSITINSVLVYDWIHDEVNKTITFDENALFYQLDEFDKIRVEVI